jgi:hypothetical protein
MMLHSLVGIISQEQKTMFTYITTLSDRKQLKMVVSYFHEKGVYGTSLGGHLQRRGCSLRHQLDGGGGHLQEKGTVFAALV